MADGAINPLIVGCGGVGKRSIVRRLFLGEYSETYVPTIEDDFTKTIKYGDKSFDVSITDTAGQDGFLSIYLKKNTYFIIVYAVDDMNSLSQVKKIFEDIRTHRDGKPFHVVVAANKCDLDPSAQEANVSVGESKIHEYAPDVSVIETSAKLNKNLDALLEKIVEIHVNQNFSDKKKDDGSCSIQ